MASEATHPTVLLYQWAWIQQPTSALLKAMVLSSLAFMITSERQGTGYWALVNFWYCSCKGVGEQELSVPPEKGGIPQRGRQLPFLSLAKDFSAQILGDLLICRRLLRWAESESWNRYLYVYMSGVTIPWGHRKEQTPGWRVVDSNLCLSALTTAMFYAQLPRPRWQL